MFEREIKFIYDFTLNQVRQLGTNFTFSSLSKINIHPAILNYISAEIDYLIFEDRQKLLQSSNFDYTGEKINNYFSFINLEIKKEKKLSYEYVSQLILHASSFIVNYLTQPKWALCRLVFTKNNMMSVSEVKLIINYTYYYDFIRNILEQYINKKKVLSISKFEMEELIEKIDAELFNVNSIKMIDNAIQAIAEFFNIGSIYKNKVPLLAIELFLKEKKLDIFLERLENALPLEPKQTYDISEIRKIIYNPIPVGKGHYLERIVKQEKPDSVFDPEKLIPVAEQQILTEEMLIETSASALKDSAVNDKIEDKEESDITTVVDNINEPGIEEQENLTAENADEGIKNPEEDVSPEPLINELKNEELLSSINAEEQIEENAIEEPDVNIPGESPDTIKIKDESEIKISDVDPLISSALIDLEDIYIENILEEKNEPEKDQEVFKNPVEQQNYEIDNGEIEKIESVDMREHEIEVDSEQKNSVEQEDSPKDENFDEQELIIEFGISDNDFILDEAIIQDEIITTPDLEQVENSKSDLNTVSDIEQQNELLISEPEQITEKNIEIDSEKIKEEIVNEDEPESDDEILIQGNSQEKSEPIEKIVESESLNEIRSETEKDFEIIQNINKESEVLNEINEEIKMLSFEIPKDTEIPGLFTDESDSSNGVDYQAEKHEPESISGKSDYLTESFFKAKKDFRSREITEFLSSKEIRKLVASIFNNDTEDFADTIDSINNCVDYQEAQDVLDSVFKSYHIKPSSKEAVLLKKAVSDYFNQ